MNTTKSPKTICVDLLHRSPCRVQMAAVLVDQQQRVYSWGWNNNYQHAEVHAIKRANPKRVSGSTLYLAGRRAKSGNWVYAFPCSSKCYKFVLRWGVTRLVSLGKDGVWTIYERRGNSFLMTLP